MTHILAIDQGTTSSRAIAFDENLKPVTSAQKEFTQFYPSSGWVEHDPEEIWETVDVLYEKNWAAFEPLEEELDVLYDELYAALEADNNADILRLAKATYQAELDIFALEDFLGISELYEEMDLLWEEAEALEGSWEHEGEGCEHDEEFDFEDYDKDDFQDEE